MRCVDGARGVRRAREPVGEVRRREGLGEGRRVIVEIGEGVWKAGVGRRRVPVRDLGSFLLLALLALLGDGMGAVEGIWWGKRVGID